MSLGSGALAEVSLAGVNLGALAGEPPPPPEPEIVIDPFSVEIAGVIFKPLINTLSLSAELGRQGSASFTLVNVSVLPLVGQEVRIYFYDTVLFGGSIDRITSETNNTESFKTYQIECVDYSYLLFRIKVRQRWTNVQWTTIASQYIFSAGLTYGESSGSVGAGTLPIVDSDNGNVHDILSEAAAALGRVFFVDSNKSVNFVSAALPSAPEPLTDLIVEEARIEDDRETYRNRQTIVVTGTPPDQNTQPVTITYTRQNDAQIAERAAIEGGDGVYNDIESITHPTSNSPTELNKLGVAYAKIRLGIQGSIRQHVSVRTRAAGFKAGQTAELSIPQLGLTGQWTIQKSSMREEDGMFGIYTLELSRSNLLRRAQELWLEMVRRGKIIALPPTTEVLTQSETITTTGVNLWTVPAGVVQVQVSCYGAGGGGGGAAKLTSVAGYYANGGNGGAGGLAVSVVSVTPGESLVLVVGIGGAPGSTATNSSLASPIVGTAGTNGGYTAFRRNASDLVSATGGLHGTGASISGIRSVKVVAGYNGGTGGGLGEINTYGGGSPGGAGGVGASASSPGAGVGGKIVLEY